jgi:nuclear pore complex protein Nup98-Nup96
MPYPSKRRRLSTSNMNEHDAAFYDSFKPSFDSHNALIYAVPGSATQLSGDMKQVIKPLTSGGRDIRFAKFTAFGDADSKTLELQKQHTELMQRDDEQSEVPRAITPAELTFATLSRAETGASSLDVQEKAIWELSSILFDPLDVAAGDLTDGMSDHQKFEFDARLRLERLQIFWSDFMASAVESRSKTTRAAEEKALLLLTKNDVVNACQVLMDAGDVKLATLVAQLPSSETTREVMRQQLQAWQERKDWSEFSDAHKALYTILTGETCIVTGLNGSSEDRTQEFCLSERFGLDWRQSLSLCLQFGGHEDIKHAVSTYITSLKEGREKVKPLPYGEASEGENTLLGLLRLAALKEAQVERLFDSATISGSALNSRLAWQLATMLEAKDLCEFPEEKMDSLTLDFASQLESTGAWTKAVWALLHLSETGSRTTAIRGVLERSAAQLPSPDLDQDNTLMEDESGWSLTSMQIPTSLIWEAKAVYAHAVLHEPALQAQWLLYTGTDEAHAEAHAVLCNTVGPRAVIEKDYTDLRELLACFDKYGGQELADWKHGGKIYADFLRLDGLVEAKKHGRDARNACWVLRKGLEGASEEGRSLEVRVAMGEIAKVLGDVERDIGIHAKYSFDGMDVDDDVKKGGVAGMLDGYRKALGVVV